MLSRRQEDRVLKILGGTTTTAGAPTTYCLEHLAAAGRVPPGHIHDLAAFIRALVMMGECEARPRGFCDANAHQTDHLLVWGRRLSRRHEA